jgi:soluble lytic murein transglycosylase-like protein
MRAAVALGLLVLAPGPVCADLALLANGNVLKVTAHRIEGEMVLMELAEGGEVGVPLRALRGLVPDEVAEEVTDQLAAGEAGDLDGLIERVARRHGLDPALVRAVVAVESGFRARAVSHKGAQGLMQLMPGTAAELGVGDAFDPAQNLDAGVRHLLSLLVRYRGDLRLALAAYNAGAGAVGRHGGVPPYRETRDYVRKVLERYEPAP